MKIQFNENFVWGVATAAAQIEGAAFEDGRGASIWDVFSRLPGKIKNGGIPDICCDSYHDIGRDVALLRELGAKAYRMSFSWRTASEKSIRLESTTINACSQP